MMMKMIKNASGSCGATPALVACPAVLLLALFLLSSLDAVTCSSLRGGVEDTIPELEESLTAENNDWPLEFLAPPMSITMDDASSLETRDLMSLTEFNFTNIEYDAENDYVFDEEAYRNIDWDLYNVTFSESEERMLRELQGVRVSRKESNNAKFIQYERNIVS
jgi:hypothetical protein